MDQVDDRKPADDEEEEIKVTDRRQFTKEGERVRSEPASPEPPSAPSDDPTPAAEAPANELFVTHVLALGQLGMMHLGEIGNPASEKTEMDLPAAREIIDLLGMLEEKTSGNLTPEEKALLETWLFQLRMAFSQKATG
jgi:Domain of unknown function (DUF1844)